MNATVEELILGESAGIQRVRDLVRQVASWPIPVLIEGPTGVGKELVAQAIHAVSGRSGRMIAVNVCAVPETLFEATLFGHTRGAFTGAHHDSPGYVLEADKGTLFLDEIGSLPPALQAKLLRVLDRREFRQVGGTRERSSDFRLISATNEDLMGLVQASAFRRDFFYRLRGVAITIPSLGERREDIPLLARHFVKIAADLANVRNPVISGEAMRLLCEHLWPGNVRELKHVMELAMVFADGGGIARPEIVEALGKRPSPGSEPESQAAAVERASLLQLMTRHDWIVASAARELEVTPKTVYSRLQRAGVKLPPRRSVVADFVVHRADVQPEAV